MGRSYRRRHLEDSEAKKVVILLTDGVNNAKHQPRHGGADRPEMGVKVYTIGVGSAETPTSPVSRRSGYIISLSKR